MTIVDTSAITKIADEIKAAEARLTEAAQAAFKDGFKLIFESYPFLAQASWSQYIPGFNDGDPCVFSTTDIGCYTANDVVELKETEEWDDYEGGPEFDRLSRKTLGWGANEKPNPDYNPAYAECLANVRSLHAAIPQATFQRLFDDNARVIITRDGVEVEEYYCGY